MALEKLDLYTYFGRCKCCLNYGYLRTMWENHIIEGEREMYGQMLTQCFSIPWTIQTREEDDQICEECVRKLRKACMFKKQVLQCQSVMEKCGPEDMKLEIIKPNPEDEEYSVEYLDEDILDSETFKHEEDSVGSENEGEFAEDVDGTESQDDEIKQEEDDQSTSEGPPPRKRQSRRHDSVSDSDTTKRKWPRKLPQEERYRTYRQYPEENLQSAIDAVMSKRMSQKDASEHYQVPRKTLCAKLRDNNDNKRVQVHPSNIRKFVREIEMVLNHVNATPFRCRANQQLCFFCIKKSPFASAHELRSHNESEHSNPSNKLLDVALRPQFNNEIIKLDIKDVACKVCNIALLNWDDTLQHLETVHNIEFEFKNKMVPFLLGDNNCAICHEQFSCFMLLHAHMNKHYKNYYCGYCGDTFASACRLRTHHKIHLTGHFPCPICKKVFTLEKYLKKHSVVHTDEMKVKCHHCDKFFRSEHQRQAHKLVAHTEHVESVTCELCGATFHWMRHFLRHMKRKHGTEYHCDQCGQFFQSKTLLKQHKFKHMGVKQFKCVICSREFFSRASMKSHWTSSHKDVKINYK